MPTGVRNSTVIAPQTLVMMNDPLVMDSAESFADHLLRENDVDLDRITIAYRRAFGA